MRKKEKLPLRVQLRRWWKGKQDDMSISLWYAWEPRWFHNLYYWTKDHLFPWNVIKIETLSCRYIDKDEILLHGAFQVLVDFVEGEWHGSEYFGHFFDLEKEEKELKADPDNTEEYIKGTIESYLDHNEKNAEIYHLYVWWKFFRPKRDEVNPLHKRHTLPEIDHFGEVYAVDEDGDPTLYEWKSPEEPEDIKQARDEMYKEYDKFEKESELEDEQMFMRLVKIRRCLWT